MVVVFHLGFGQGCLAGGTPVDGFFTLVDASVQIEFSELFDGCGLVGIGHREIVALPIAENTEPLELFPLDIHVLLGVGPADAPLFAELKTKSP